MIDALWLGVRAGAYLLVLQATGTLLFLMLFGARMAPAEAVVSRTAQRCAVGALILCCVQLLLAPAYMAGEAAGMLDASLLALVLHSRVALVLVLRLAAIGCVLLALRARARGQHIGAAGGAALCLLVGSFLVSGHTVTSGARLFLVPLLGLHVLAVSFWLGALWPLRQLAVRLAPAPLAALLGDFSKLALAVVPLLALAGLAMACLLLPGLAALRTPYGLLLCAKAVLFAVLLGLAALNRQRLTPALAQDRPGAAQVLRRSLAAEYALIVLVLCATAALTGLFSPQGH